MAFAPLSNEQLFELETKFVRIYVHTAKAPAKSRWAPEGAPAPEPPYQVVFRKPDRNQYKMFRSQANRDDQKAASQENLAKGSVVAVVVGGVQTVNDGTNKAAVQAAFDTLLNDYPAIPEAVVLGIGNLIGHGGEDESEKG